MSHLAASDKNSALATLLTNELDIAFRSRVLTMFEFLTLSNEDRVLDCGCGRGFYLRLIRELYSSELTGIDPDKDTLAIARSKLKDKNIKLLHASANELPFSNNVFDKILFSEVLEHIPNDSQALKEIWRVLRPGGVLALTVPNARYPFLWDPINRTLESLFDTRIRTGILAGIWTDHQRLYKLEDILALAEQSGFAVEEIRHLTYYCFPFSHNLLYGVGKELFDRGLLPAGIEREVDRFEVSSSKNRAFSFVRKIFQGVDKLNRNGNKRGSSVCIALKLIRR